MKKNMIITAIFLIMFLGWEAISRLNSHMIFVLPAPSKILITLWKHSDRFALHTMATLKEMLGGFVLALSVAFPLAGLMLVWKSLRQILQPIMIVIQCIPMIALAPIMVIWFSWSYTAIVIPTALMIFFPMTMNIYRGLHSTPSHLIEYFRVNQATALQTFFKLQLPWALPHICSGFRISAAIAGIGAVTGEWAGAQKGLGILMLESRRGADLEMTFGALFCLTLLSLFLFGSMILFEEQFLNRGTLNTLKKALLKLDFMLLKPFKAFSSLMVLAVAVGSMIFYSWGETEPLKSTRLVLDWLPNPNHIPIYAGIEKGFFQKYGIELLIQKMHDPADGMSYLTSKQADLAISYMPASIRFAVKGAEIKVIAKLIKEPLNCLMFRRDEGIVSPDDLNGKVFGYCIDGTQVRTLDILLRDRSVWSKTTQNVSFDLVSTLGTKKVDAVYGAFWNIETEHLKSLNIEAEYFKVSDFGMPHYYELIVLAGSETEFSSPDFVQRFQAALQESINYSKIYPDSAFEAYLKMNLDKGEKTQDWESRSWKLTQNALAIDQHQDFDVWQSYLDWQIAHKLVEGPFDVNKMITF